MRDLLATAACAALAAAALCAGPKTLARSGEGTVLPKDPRDVPTEAVLSQVRSRADLDGGGVKEELWLVNAVTGRRAPAEASEVIFGVVAGRGEGEERAELLYSRHMAAATGEPAHHGELMAIDLDGDGGSEVLLTWSRSVDETVRERWAEIYAFDPPLEPRRVWEGYWLRDTTDQKGLPPEQRHHFRREIDYGATRGAAGVAIVFEKTVLVAAGQRFEPPKTTRERIAVRLRPASSRR
jgi:hypothetical protein